MANVTPEPAGNQQGISISGAKKMLMYELRVLDEIQGPGVLAPPVMVAMLELDNAVYKLALVMAES